MGQGIGGDPKTKNTYFTIFFFSLNDFQMRGKQTIANGNVDMRRLFRGKDGVVSDTVFYLIVQFSRHFVRHLAWEVLKQKVRC